MFSLTLLLRGGYGTVDVAVRLVPLVIDVPATKPKTRTTESYY